MSDPDSTAVWQAGRSLRRFSYLAIVVLVLLAARVVVAFGWLATIGVLLVLAAAFQVWWMVLRPHLTAGPDGVEVVAGRDPVRLPWSDIRRAEAGPQGLRIVCTDGREVISKFPQQTKASTPGEQTEADRCAAYLAQRAAWARRADGTPPPRYQPVVPR